MIELRVTDSVVVLTLWWVAVGLTALVIVPVALHLLHKTLRKARSIRRLTADALTAAEGILGNVQSVSALEDTVRAATPLVPAGERLEEKATRLADVLATRSGG